MDRVTAQLRACVETSSLFQFGLKVFMDARMLVTHKEGDRYPLGPPNDIYSMIHIIKTITDKFLNLIEDDPVRPNIPRESRVGDNKDIFVLRDENGVDVKAIVCVSYQSEVPTSESELFRVDDNPTIAVFYTVWSYDKGSGRQVIFDAVDYIKENLPHIKRFVTLSPKTELAKRFHLKNGAVVFRENETSVNYEYEVYSTVAQR